jgi:hypothetical protein
MTTPDIIRAHKRSIHHREEVLASAVCGCFHCCQIFPPAAIHDWTDHREEVGQTALCPKCGIDSVIGSASAYPITQEFLVAMSAHWFLA